MILIGHNITELRKLPEKSVHCCITSPPYWGLRAYGTDPQTWGGSSNCQHDFSFDQTQISHEPSNSSTLTGGRGPRQDRALSIHGTCLKCGAWRGELGSEPTPEMFTAHMVEVFAEVWRVLRDDGTCWVNLGDSYSAGGRGSFDVTSDNKGNGAIRGLGRPSPAGVKPKDLIGIPWRVAFALQAAGWYLRQDIIWHKPNPMPESVRDRCTKAHEYLFLLTKSERYFFDGEAIKTKAIGGAPGNKTHKHTAAYEGGDDRHRTKAGLLNVGEVSAANRRSVWSISTHSYKGAHFATYPPRLVEPCILAGTSAKGCCPHCGKPWARVVESKRVPTRSGANSKVHYVDPAGSPYADHKGKIVGNRDPLRHVSANITTGWQQACKCEAHEPVPCTVLDPFGGSGTTAIVAAHHGRKWIICELNPEYAQLAEQRISEGWTPPKVKKPRRKRHTKQKALFNAEAC